MDVNLAIIVLFLQREDPLVDFFVRPIFSSQASASRNLRQVRLRDLLFFDQGLAKLEDIWMKFLTQFVESAMPAFQVIVASFFHSVNVPQRWINLSHPEVFEIHQQSGQFLSDVQGHLIFHVVVRLLDQMQWYKRNSH